MTAVIARVLMSCDEAEPLLSPLVDGELLEEDRAAVLGHLETCLRCRGRMAALERARTTLAHAGRQVELPDELAVRLRDSIIGAARREGRARVGRLIGAAAALGIVVSASRLWVAASVETPPETAPVVGDLAARHELELPVDVASPDPRRVQEFLAARVGHPLRVPHLDQLGWGLQGGRVVDVEQRRGAHLIYRGGYGQRLSVVVLPDPDGLLRDRVLPRQRMDAPGVLAAVAHNGLHVRVVARDDSLYSFVGDVEADSLERLSDTLER